MIDDFPYMDLALTEASAAATRGEVPVGAVIVSAEGEILAAAGNRVIELCDPTAHAEILAIRQAAFKMDSERLAGCDMFVTLEPCAMCAQAISFARIRRLYFGAVDEKSGGITVGARIYSHVETHHKPEIYSGIREKAATKILKDFFVSKR